MDVTTHDGMKMVSDETMTTQMTRLVIRQMRLHCQPPPLPTLSITITTNVVSKTKLLISYVVTVNENKIINFKPRHLKCDWLTDCGKI